MIMVFGGAYQGKLDYVLERFGFVDGDIYRCDSENCAIPAGKRVIYEFDKWILALTYSEKDAAEYLQCFIEANPEAIVICNDISCGVVPENPVLRKWREAVGRSLAELSRRADETVRLFCGIPMTIKHQI